MSQFVVTYDRQTGAIQGWRYEHDPAYTPVPGELVRDDDVLGPPDLIGRMVDTTASPPVLVVDPDFVPIAELRHEFQQAATTPAEDALYDLLLRALGDELFEQEYRERAYGPGPDLAPGWKTDPSVGRDS